MTEQPSIGTPNVNVPPPPAQAGRSWIRWLLIGVGGCLVLVVLLRSEVGPAKATASASITAPTNKTAFLILPTFLS